MPQRQLLLWESNAEAMPSERPCIPAAATVAEARCALAESLYTPVKRIHIVYEGSILSRPALTSCEDAIRFFADYWQQQPGHDQERFVVACLNVKNRVQSVVPVTVGTLDASLVHPREVFRPAIVQGASSVILSHNHPSGDPTPSHEDHVVTRRLTECGELLGIQVLDHIVHGDGTGRLTSMRQS